MKGLFIGFIILQIGIDLAHTATAFPFVHYGMYSESFAKPDSIAVFEVIADGKPLAARDFRIYRWDMVQVPLAGFDEEMALMTFNLSRDKQEYQPAYRPGQTVSHQSAWLWYHTLIPRETDNDYTIDTRFPQWYKQYLSRLLGHPIHALRVDKVWYRYSHGRFVPLRRENWINA